MYTPPFSPLRWTRHLKRPVTSARAPLALLVFVFALPCIVTGQPRGWAVYIPWDWGSPTLSVINLATGAQEASFSGPFNGWVHAGGLTPDGRYYLLATARGIARFRTDPIAPAGVIGLSTSLYEVAISPAGTRAYAWGAAGHHTVDWESGVVLETSCCDVVQQIAFTPDGGIRLQVTLRSGENSQLSAISEQSGAVLWTRALDGLLGTLAVSISRVAFTVADRGAPATVILNLADGSERARRTGTSPHLRWRGNQLLASERLYVPLSRSRLSVFDDLLTTERVLVERPANEYDSTGPVVVSYDSRYAYWLTYENSPQLRTMYDVVDLDTEEVIGRGPVGFDYWTLALEQADRCVLGVPGSVAGPPEGGTVGIPVVPTANCRPWTVPGQPSVVNPGPHTGPATIAVHTWPNTQSQPRHTPVTIGLQPVLVAQPASVPAAPTLEAAVTGDRVTLFWTPAIGAGITGFLVRGAIAGGRISDVFQLPAHLRTWTSPLLSSGSYEVELVATNEAGRSAASNRRAFSIGVVATPEPPSGLIASVADDRVALSWTPAAAMPAPSGFVVEAAATDSAVFVPVARTAVPAFVAPLVPMGTWHVRVRSATAGGVSEPSAAISVTTSPCVAPPDPPRSLWALWTPPTVSVQWSPPLRGAVEEYVIEVGRTSASVDVARLVVPGTRLSHTEPVSSLAAFVRVRALNACGRSAPSAEIPIIVY